MTGTSLQHGAKVIPHPAWVLRQAIAQTKPRIEHCPQCGVAIESANEGQANRLLARHLVQAHMPAPTGSAA